jgi:hypothetical protein
MRRAALAVVVSVVVLAGPAGSASAGDQPTKTVSYEGYEITVPASWPVVRLDNEPARCVRYDMNAVYLGSPGPDQLCPPGLVGRTATVSIAAVPQFQRAAVIAEPALPGMTGGEQVSQVPALNAAVMLDQSAHQLRVAMRTAGQVLITATYGSDPAQVTRVLATLRHVTQQSRRVTSSRATTGPSVDARAARDRAAVPGTVAAVRAAAAVHGPAAAVRAAAVRGPAAVRAAAASVRGAATPPAVRTTRPVPPRRSGHWTEAATAAARMLTDTDVLSDADGKIVITIPPATTPPPAGQPSPEPSPTVGKPKPAPRPPAALPGFDTCTAPSLRAMRAWRAKYAVAGVYIGGSNMACDYGNLSPGWVRTVTSMGWGLLPTYVGPQAPCYGAGDMINAKHAAVEGQAAGRDAAEDATDFGLPVGSPVYYDMEAYNESERGCVTAVLRFLSAWTRTLNGLGYMSGVYSSADSGILDLQSAAKDTTMTEPQAIWFALWDGKASLTGAQVLGARPWTVSRRVKQFAGSHLQKVGGVSLNIDSDLVGGLVAR